MTFGTVEGIEGNTLTITTQAGGTVKVQVTDTTLIEKNASVRSLTWLPDDTVIVSGSDNTDGSITARSVQVAPAGRLFGEPPVNSWRCPERPVKEVAMKTLFGSSLRCWLSLALARAAYWFFQKRSAADTVTPAVTPRLWTCRQGNIDASSSVVGELYAPQNETMRFERLAGTTNLVTLAVAAGQTVAAGQALATIDHTVPTGPGPSPQRSTGGPADAGRP